jgi:hypothetical protein
MLTSPKSPITDIRHDLLVKKDRKEKKKKEEKTEEKIRKEKENCRSVIISLTVLQRQEALHSDLCSQELCVTSWRKGTEDGKKKKNLNEYSRRKNRLDQIELELIT